MHGFLYGLPSDCRDQHFLLESESCNYKKMQNPNETQKNYKEAHNDHKDTQNNHKYTQDDHMETWKHYTEW